MRVERCDECGTEEESGQFREATKGWFEVNRDQADTYIQEWSFCSQACIAAFFNRGPVPDPEPIPGGD